MTATTITADVYLRLSDFRADDADSFPARERKLRAKAAELGWTVARTVIENDLTEDGRRKPASAFKRRRITTPSGRVELRTVRPGWRQVLADLTSGAATAVLAEDLDRVARDPRDLEDLIDAIAGCGGHARSISGSLMLTDGGTSDQVTMARVMVAMGNKSSADTARRVAAGRERSALAGSFGGGRRPFGYRADPDAPKGRKTLIVVPEEAEVIRRTADAVLAEGDLGMSLRFMARELREGSVATVTGCAWASRTLKDIMIKPTLAGIAVNTRTGTETAGAWPAILQPDVWQAVVDKLSDPARRTNVRNGNAPVWMGSGIYRCGICDDGGSVQCHGGRDRASPAYTCTARAHLRRNAAQTDAYVGLWVVARLSRPDAADLLRPPDKPGADCAALRSEARRLESIGGKQSAMHALGHLSDADLKAGARARMGRLDQIAAQLSATTAPDPLAEFRDEPDAEAVWDALPLGRKRDVLARLAVVTLKKATRRGRGFDPDSVLVEPATFLQESVNASPLSTRKCECLGWYSRP
jgi:DNA invertase Pin-like site-specific DNA recombinase